MKAFRMHFYQGLQPYVHALAAWMHAQCSTRELGGTGEATTLYSFISCLGFLYRGGKYNSSKHKLFVELKMYFFFFYIPRNVNVFKFYVFFFFWGGVCEYLRIPLKMLITAYFNCSNTMHIFICINVHSGNGLTLHYCRSWQPVFLSSTLGGSQPRKGTLNDLQMPG